MKMSSASRSSPSGVRLPMKVRSGSNMGLGGAVRARESRDTECLTNGGDVVNAKDACAALGGEQTRGDRSADPLVGHGTVDGRDERLSARSHHHWDSLVPELAEPAEELERLTRVLGEAYPRVEPDVRGLDAARHGAIPRFTPFGSHLRDDVPVTGV